MISLLRTHSLLLQKLLVGLFLVWGFVMLGSLWFSGEKETEAALASGKRFVLHINSGKVDGRDVTKLEAPIASAQTQTEAVTTSATESLPPSPEETSADVAPVSEVPLANLDELAPIQQSANPIAAVDAQLTEKQNNLTLPRIGSNGVKPWVYYAKPFKRPDERPVIALVVIGLGQSRTVTQAALGLNEHIALSFTPYSRALSAWADAARTSGHEFYIDLPTQTGGYPMDDQGPYSLLLSRSNTQNMNYLYWALSRTQGYTGVLTAVDSVLSTSVEAYKPIAGELAKRGVALFLGHEPLQRETRDVIDQSQVPKVIADVWIDEEMSEMSIQARLATLEQMAQRNGYAVGVVHAYPLSVAQIKLWQDKVSQHGFQLAPPSFIVKLGK